MSETVFNADGSVYMSFPPVQPSPADPEGWCIRMVTTAHHTPQRTSWNGSRWVATGRELGTVAFTRTDVLSFNDLLRDLGSLEATYGYRPLSSRVGSSHYRWTFERWTPDGHHVSDMIIANKIG